MAFFLISSGFIMTLLLINFCPVPVLIRDTMANFGPDYAIGARVAARESFAREENCIRFLIPSIGDAAFSLTTHKHLAKVFLKIKR